MSKDLIGHPPVIIIGMHRSGTTILSRLLDNFGLFSGSKKGPYNNEALLFQRLNNWILQQAGARWDFPMPIDYLLNDNELISLVENFILQTINGLSSINFLGMKRYLRYRGIFGFNMPWGWKDPRTTFTLPIWLRIFPEAKVIYVERHGVDVAQSLKVRRDKMQKRNVAHYKKWHKRFSLFSAKHTFSHSLRCKSLNGAFSLWEEYVKCGRMHVESIPDGRCFSLRYEDLLKDGEMYLSQLVDFCGLTTSDATIKDSVKKFDKNRAYAYRKNAKLLVFAHSVSDRLMGYKAQ